MEQRYPKHQGTNFLCDQCDLVVRPPKNKADKIVCPRCTNLVFDYSLRSNHPAFIYALCAMVMFFASCAFYFVDIRIVGNVNSIGLFTIPDILFNDQHILLSLLFLVFVLLFPFLCLLSLIILCSVSRLPTRIKIILLLIINKLQPWCMTDIFLVGVLVSFVKLTNYGEIAINISFLPCCFFILLQIKTFSSFNPTIIWNQITPTVRITPPPKIGITAIKQGIRLCPCCRAMLYINKRVCPRCYVSASARIKRGLQWTMALLLTAVMLYVPANVLAVMMTFFIGDVTYSTIYDGISFMWKQDDYPVAIIIFTASIMIPILKMIALAWLCYFSLYSGWQNRQACLKMNKIYNIVEFIGRWSMIDIFVVAVTSTLIRNGQIISIYPDRGIVFFAAVVILTMLASMKYDRRFIWDKMKCTTNK